MESAQQQLKVDMNYIMNLPEAAVNSMWADPENHELWETSTRKLISNILNFPQIKSASAVREILQIHIASRCHLPHVLSSK